MMYLTHETEKTSKDPKGFPVFVLLGRSLLSVPLNCQWTGSPLPPYWQKPG
jgi:hypothetical protein